MGLGFLTSVPICISTNNSVTLICTNLCMLWLIYNIYVMTYCLHNVIKKQRNVLHVIDYKFIVGIQRILLKTKCTVWVTSLDDAGFIKNIQFNYIIWKREPQGPGHCYIIKENVSVWDPPWNPLKAENNIKFYQCGASPPRRNPSWCITMRKHNIKNYSNRWTGVYTELFIYIQARIINSANIVSQKLVTWVHSLLKRYKMDVKF